MLTSGGIRKAERTYENEIEAQYHQVEIERLTSSQVLYYPVVGRFG